MSEYKFKPFEKVLVRDNDTEEWLPKLYFKLSDNKKHAVITGSSWRQCIPYEGNEELCGTNDSPEPEFKNGDIVAVWDKDELSKKIRIYSHYDSEKGKHVTYLTRDTFSNWDCAEKFVPATVEGQEGS